MEGPARFDDRADSLKASAGYFRAGETKLEQVQTHAWGDTIVLVMIERQHGEVGSLPDQDWSLRVTHVYRSEGSDWLLVHRHADRSFTPSIWNRWACSPAARCCRYRQPLRNLMYVPASFAASDDALFIGWRM